MFFIYILHSENPERRLIQHNDSPHLTFTSKHRPWKLAAKIEIADNRSDAIMIEKYIKKRKSKKFIEEIILKQSDLVFIEKLKKLSSAG